MKTKYSPNMSEAEYANMLKEILELDEAYGVADKMQREFDKQFPIKPGEEPEDEMDELRKAALNHRGEP